MPLTMMGVLLVAKKKKKKIRYRIIPLLLFIVVSAMIVRTFTITNTNTFIIMEEPSSSLSSSSEKDNVQLKQLFPTQPKFKSKPSCKRTVLASFPGSGSTITRLLIEMSTGIYTGSIYGDSTLYNAKPYPFIGETTTKHVVAIKSHVPHGGQKQKINRVKRVVLIIRNPYAAIPSLYNFIWAATSTEAGGSGSSNNKHRHEIQAPKKAWEEWRDSSSITLSKEVEEWVYHFSYWMESPYDELFVGKFEDLVTDKIKGPKTLQEIVKFLDCSLLFDPSSSESERNQRIHTIWEQSMNLSNGNIHRNKSYLPQYLPSQSTLIYNELSKLKMKKWDRRMTPPTTPFLATTNDTNNVVATMLDDYMKSKTKYTTTAT